MKKYRKAVFIVAYRFENKPIYLILKRKLHWKGWEFPKGGIEENENLIKAVKRELKEETGQSPLKIKKFEERGKYKYHKKFEDRPGITGQEFQLFSAEIKTQKIKLDRKEHSNYKWLEFKKALKLLTFNDQKKCLKIVNNFLVKQN